MWQKGRVSEQMLDLEAKSEKATTYESHLASNRYKHSILDAMTEHAQNDIETVESKWREDPWRGIDGVIAQRDKERDEA